MTSASLMHEAGHSKPVLWGNPEGRAVERGSRWGATYAPVGDSCRCVAQTTTIL